jgi:sporulation protein YlmC with PRC-barrel domain
MRQNEFDIGHWILDDQLVDSDGRRCGRVDDIEFEGAPGRKTVITAILVGPGAYRMRFGRRLRSLVSHVLADTTVRVPWKAVRRLDVVVELKGKSKDLGLGAGDDEAEKIVAKIPGADR